MLYEIHDIARFPSLGEFCSYARLVKGQKSSAGKSYGTSGGRIGNAHLRWAFSEASLLYLRGNEQAQKYYPEGMPSAQPSDKPPRERQSAHDCG
jgi:transposase